MFFAPSKSRQRAKLRNMCLYKINTISKSTSRCQTPVRNLQRPTKPQSGEMKIKMTNPSQDSLASSKAPNQDLKNMDVLCTFKMKIEGQNLNHRYIKDQWQYPNQDQDANPESGTSSILQSPKWGLKWHLYSLHFQIQDREPKLRSWGYQRPVTMSKSRSTG